MTRSTRRALGLATALAPLASHATPALAYIPGAPPCYGASCVGKSPYITNREGVSCAAGAVDFATVDGPGDSASNQVTLRWSNFCHANWARWSGPDIGYADYWAQSYDGHRELPEGYYSYMVDGNQLARACVVAYTFSNYYACTNWH